jgi:predicted nucleic acid-binding protein
MGALVRIPAPVLVEIYRGRKDDAAIDHTIKRVGRVVPAGHSIAKLAGGLLAKYRLGSEHAIDAIVVATAIRLGGGLIATHDPKDMKRLAQAYPNVKVLAI